MRKKLSVLLVALFLLGAASACERKTKVGDPDLLKFEQQQARRIGDVIESPEPTNGQVGAIGQSPSPSGEEEEEEKRVASMALIKTSPYYSPGNAIQQPVNTVLQITNNDDKVRRLVSMVDGSPDGTYDTGDIAPGATVELLLDVRGSFQLGDMHVPFATGTIEVF